MNLADCFLPGEILIPRNVDLQRWSVIACDQFTSDPAYWQRVGDYVGDAPSTLRMMLPEAWLGCPEEAELQASILKSMEDYLHRGIFETLQNSFVYLERTLSGGGLRRGILGLLDLEYYDYQPDSCSPIHATEGLVMDRLPPRIKLRQGAPLELPHLVVFCDDPALEVMDCASRCAGRLLYDTPLMEGGGRVRGWSVEGSGVKELRRSLETLGEEHNLQQKYGTSKFPVLYAVGDGNHSLATAKRIWEELRETLTPAQRLNHPARFALAELVDLHEPAMEFEAIHRVLFHTDTEHFLQEARVWFAADAGKGRAFRCITGKETEALTVSGTIGQAIARCEAFVEDYRKRFGGTIDYIHGEAEAVELCRQAGCAGILMPEMDKRDLFPSIIQSGTLPKKSFSIGPARDKRYYMECRKIR